MLNEVYLDSIIYGKKEKVMINVEVYGDEKEVEDEEANIYDLISHDIFELEDKLGENKGYRLGKRFGKRVELDKNDLMDSIYSQLEDNNNNKIFFADYSALIEHINSDMMLKGFSRLI